MLFEYCARLCYRAKVNEGLCLFTCRARAVSQCDILNISPLDISHRC